jgi:superfamily II DNA or RNA helicase
MNIPDTIQQCKIALEKGLPFMTKEQESIVKECMGKKTFGLSLSMGSGKTFISLLVGLKRKVETCSTTPILVVVSKSLISSWIIEIGKFFGDTVPYQVMNEDVRNFVLSDSTILVLVTPDTAANLLVNFSHESNN